jgi:hypothetical protein
MRKILEIIALVLTIIASLVALIVFLSGRNSLPALVSGSTPTTGSSSPTFPPTTASSISNVEGDAFQAVLHSSMTGVAVILMIILIVLVLIVVTSGMRKASGSLEGMFLGAIVFFFVPMLVPPVVSYLTYELLGLVITPLVSLILLGNIIIYSVSLSIAYISKRFIMTL